MCPVHLLSFPCLGCGAANRTITTLTVTPLILIPPSSHSYQAAIQAQSQLLRPLCYFFRPIIPPCLSSSTPSTHLTPTLRGRQQPTRSQGGKARTTSNLSAHQRIQPADDTHVVLSPTQHQTTRKHERHPVRRPVQAHRGRRIRIP